MTASVRYRAAVALRVVTSLGGGYAFTWGVFTFGIAALVAFGIDYDEAFTVFRLLGFLIFLSVFLWTFAARSLPAVMATLFGGGAVMTALAWVVQNQLVQGA